MLQKEDHKKTKRVAVIVAHPDDETLWVGGAMLLLPALQWFTLCLCRASDENRAPRFYETLKILHSEGVMGDLDDDPEQTPLDDKVVEQTILDLLPPKHYDLLITHNPSGECTRHVRHEETGKAVIRLWHDGKISASQLWVFAYEDSNKKYYPKPIANAAIFQKLPNKIWQKKYCIITETYGFEKDSFEAKITPRAEAFWRFTNSQEAVDWLNSCPQAIGAMNNGFLDTACT